MASPEVTQSSRDEQRPDESPDEHVDSLPEDLDISNFVGQITFPNNSRRRIPALMYVLMGAAAILVSVMLPDSVATNEGLLVTGIVLLAFGAYGFWAGRRMTIDEEDALVRASAHFDFPVGHASAQQVWKGWTSRPTWRILAFSNENPPAFRGIALVDAIDGTIVEAFSETNPEEWSDVEVEVVEVATFNEGVAPDPEPDETASDTPDRSNIEAS